MSCLFLLCKSLNTYAPAETHVVRDVTTVSPWLSCQVYIPSIIHISKRIYFHFYLPIYTLGGRGTLYNPKSEKVGTVWKTQIKKKVVISKFTLTCISLQTI